MTEWIKCNDRLPVTSGTSADYLVRLANWDMCVAGWMGIGGWDFDPESPITHWRTLPDHPEPDSVPDTGDVKVKRISLPYPVCLVFQDGTEGYKIFPNSKAADSWVAEKMRKIKNGFQYALATKIQVYSSSFKEGGEE